MKILNLIGNREEREINYNALIESFSNNSAYISKKSVEKIPVVHESVKKIAGTIASLPIELMLRTKEYNKIIEDDKRLFLLNGESNDYMTAYNYKYRIIEDLLLYGKHYSYIQRKGTRIIGLHPIEFKTVTEKDAIDGNGVIIDKEINYTLNNMVQKKNAYEILIIDSGNKGILNSSKLLELMLEHDKMLESVIKNTAMPLGLLKTDNRLTQPAIDRMRQSWKNLYAGTNNVGKTIILEEGMSYQSFDIDLNKFQSSDNKKIFIEDVQRLFNLYDIKDDSDYLKYTISPIVACIENALTSQLLLSRERDANIKFRVNCEEVARASESERIQSIVLAVKNGLLTINEARQRLDENPFILDSGKDFLSVTQGNVMLFRDSTLTIPNMALSLNAEGQERIQRGGR